MTLSLENQLLLRKQKDLVKKMTKEQLEDYYIDTLKLFLKDKQTSVKLFKTLILKK